LDADGELDWMSRNRTLNGGRAERIEYMLLHEFHRLKYICPDKFSGKNKAAIVKAEVEEGDGAAAISTKGKGGKRDKYKGGLVFEPKRGLWDKFVLVMDFNSLYPSIIQEYNIDFTTLSVATEEDVRLSFHSASSFLFCGSNSELIICLINFSGRRRREDARRTFTRRPSRSRPSNHFHPRRSP
jgi:DNA polymerase elongation subunit (family B)